MADPGFPRGGGTNSRGGRQHTILANFPKKLHEIERIWTQGGTHPSRPLSLDPPLRILQFLWMLETSKRFI